MGAPEWRIGGGQGRSRMALWRWPGALLNGALAVSRKKPERRHSWMLPNGEPVWPATFQNSNVAVARDIPDCVVAVCTGASVWRAADGQGRFRALAMTRGAHRIAPWWWRVTFLNDALAAARSTPG